MIFKLVTGTILKDIITIVTNYWILSKLIYNAKGHF